MGRQTANAVWQDPDQAGLGAPTRFRRRQLGPVRQMTGDERRLIYPTKGLFKLSERVLDKFASRHVFPHIFRNGSPYDRWLRDRLVLTEGDLEPPRWSREAPALRVLHLSDLHAGPFIQPAVLAGLIAELMALEPDLVAITGDAVTSGPHELDPLRDALGLLASAPLGAWFCLGNHDHFSGEPEKVLQVFRECGVNTLRNESAVIDHRGHALRIGGLDDRVLGVRDWEAVTAEGVPEVLLAHNPDDLYEAQERGVALVLSGHTHGGQIRLPGKGPIIRQSRFCLDEGAFAHGGTQLVVSRGIGAVGLPLRVGADPEALLLTIRRP